jgi:glucose 1-dehydrogenase
VGRLDGNITVITGGAGAIGGMIPAGRYGESEDVGRLALYLASNDSRYITGATISVDGGMSVG